MQSRLWAGVFALAMACSDRSASNPESVAQPTKSTEAKPTPSAPAPSATTKPRSSIAVDLKPLLARLSYKPDPYATQPGCISEEVAERREQLLLSVQMRLSREQDGTLAIAERNYAVSDAALSAPPDTAAQVGIPRLEVVYDDGHVEGVDFVGEYREPSDPSVHRTTDQVPGDVTWVPAWLASVRVTQGAMLHRVVLDGHVLAEQKRPADAPRLSAIDCDDTRAEGLRLSWSASSSDPSAPLFVDVLQNGPLGFTEVLPLADARTVDGLTLTPSERPADRDLVLLVAVTDTFRLVTRGVLVPKKAL